MPFDLVLETCLVTSLPCCTDPSDGQVLNVQNSYPFPGHFEPNRRTLSVKIKAQLVSNKLERNLIFHAQYRNKKNVKSNSFETLLNTLIGIFIKKFQHTTQFVLCRFGFVTLSFNSFDDFKDKNVSILLKKNKQTNKPCVFAVFLPFGLIKSLLLEKFVP